MTRPEMPYGFFETALLDSLRAALIEITGEEGAASAAMFHLELGGGIDAPLIHRKLRTFLGDEAAALVEATLVRQFCRRLEVSYEEPMTFDFESLILKAAVDFSKFYLVPLNV